MGILHRDDYSNPHYYAMVDSTHYQVLHPHVVEERTLQKGDIIVSVGGRDVFDADSLTSALSETDPTLKVYRNNAYTDITIK